jgi:hypothetical protein
MKRATLFVLALGVVLLAVTLAGTLFLVLLDRDRRASGLPPLLPAGAPAAPAGTHAGGPQTDDEREVYDWIVTKSAAPANRISLEFLKWGPHDLDGLTHWEDPRGCRRIRVVTLSKYKGFPPQNVMDSIYDVPYAGTYKAWSPPPPPARVPPGRVWNPPDKSGWYDAKGRRISGPFPRPNFYGDDWVDVGIRGKENARRDSERPPRYPTLRDLFFP